MKNECTVFYVRCLFRQKINFDANKHNGMVTHTKKKILNEECYMTIDVFMAVGITIILIGRDTM